MAEKIIIITLFVLVTAFIGFYSRNKVKNVGDFVLGGRNVGAWLTAFAYGTTYFSAVIFIGYAGKIGWGFGVSAVWIGIGNALIGSLLAWLILGKRTRRMTRHMDAHTMPEFFEKRYDSKPLKIVSSIIIFIFLVPYSASVYTGLAYLFQKALGVDYLYCMIGMAVLTGIYLVLGGYFATALNDFVQGIIMLVGIVLIIGFVINRPEVGGLSMGLDKLTAINPNFTSIFGGNPRDLFGLVILTSLGTWGLPQLVHKFYSIKDDTAIKRGTIISTVFALIIAGGSYFIGAFGKLFLNNTVPMEAGKANFDLVMPQVLNVALPAVLMGIVIVLVLSASMSTLSSLVLVSSSTITLDFIKSIFAPDMKMKNQVLIIRWLCALFVAASFGIALMKGPIISLMSYSWGAIAGAFLAPFLYGLFWKGVTRAGVWSGFITGVGITLFFLIVTNYFPKLLSADLVKIMTAPNVGALAMLASLIVVPIVSLLTPKMNAAVVEDAFAALKD